MNRYDSLSYDVFHDTHTRQFQFTVYSATPLLLMLQPAHKLASADPTAQSLPFKAYEPSMDMRGGKTRSVFIEASFNVETGEAERIAVDWTAKGGASGTSRKSTRCGRVVHFYRIADSIQLSPTYILKGRQSRCSMTEFKSS